MDGLPDGHARVLARFAGPGGWSRLGSGGEATVYAIDEARVLRIHHVEPWCGDELEQAYRAWSTTSATTFDLPDVLESGVDHGLWWQVQRRFPGRTVKRWLRELPETSGPARTRMLERYVDASFEIADIASAAEYGPLLVLQP